MRFLLEVLRKVFFANFGTFYKGGGGGGQSAPEAPSPPSTGQSMKEYVENFPEYAEQQIEYQPKFARTELETLKELYPKTAAAQEDLAGEAYSMIEEGLSKEEEAAYRDTFRAQLGQNVEAPIGAEYLSRKMTLADIAKKEQGMSMLASLGGRAPIVGQPVNTSGFTPQGVMNSNAQNYSTQMSGYNAQLGYMSNQNALNARGGGMSGWGAMAGGLLGGMMHMSSKTFKKDISKNTVDSVKIIKGIDIVTFKYKPEITDDDRTRIGVIAEDSPDIMTSKDKKYIDLGNISGLLLDAVKKLTARIESLERRGV